MNEINDSKAENTMKVISAPRALLIGDLLIDYSQLITPACRSAAFTRIKYRVSSGFYSVSSFCKSSIISAFVGSASIEPNFVQAKAPAAEANLAAFLTSSFTAQ